MKQDTDEEDEEKKTRKMDKNPKTKMRWCGRF